MLMRDKINNTISDMVVDLLYYDRKEDDTLPVGKIEKLIKEGKLSTEDIVNKFREELIKGIKL